MSYKIRLKITARCPRHRNYNPAREPAPEAAVKGGCEACQRLVDIEKHRRAIEALPKPEAAQRKRVGRQLEIEWEPKPKPPAEKKEAA
jgi:hypothetical protein